MSEGKVRLDKWLKVARFFKQRQKAADEVESGHVKVNGERVKPSKLVQSGDILTVKKKSQYFKYTIKGISEKSISAELARELYEAHEQERVTKEQTELMKLLQEAEVKVKQTERTKGRPTKRDRRVLDKFKWEK